MKKIICFRCDKEPEKRLLNGEYWCKQCQRNYSAAEVRDHLFERIKEIERRMQQKECVTCGRQLIKPDWTTRTGVWCSWCGREPESGEDIINLMRDRISVCDAIIAKGEPVVFKNARLGDKQAIERIFKKTFEWKVGESIYKSFLGLGTVVVDFLIAKLNSKNKIQAARALEALGEIGSPGAFTQLLNLLERNYGVQGELLKDSLQFKIVNVLNRILERVGEEIPDNDLIAASKIKDMSVRLFRFIKIGEAEDAYGKYTDGYRSFVTDTVNCTSLREAAQQEIKRRGLTL